VNDIDLGTGVTVDGWDHLGYNCICSNWFVAAKNVEHGEWRLVCAADCGGSKLRSCVFL
jgi:hypothetical protein